MKKTITVWIKHDKAGPKYMATDGTRTIQLLTPVTKGEKTAKRDAKRHGLGK